MKRSLSFLLILMLLCVNVSGDIDTKETSTTVFDGNILYVGGSGPNNYTKIHDAVHAASAGDTVFVYSGFYHEGDIGIYIPLNIIGENKETTIIDCTDFIGSFFIDETHDVTISGFTIQNCYNPPYPSYSIKVYICDKIIICNNIFQENSGNAIDIYHSNNNQVYNNLIINNRVTGIHINVGSDNVIRNNNLNFNQNGIEIISSPNSEISGNTIKNCKNKGIDLIQCENNKIFSNQITDNNRGICLRDSNNNSISHNNIYKNKIKCYEDDAKNNVWDSNYWGRFRFFPKIIFGKRYLIIYEDKIWNIGFYIPWFNFDRNPASEPYDIEV